MERRLTMPLGVVVERREIEHRWQKYSWRPVAVLPGAPAIDAWRELARGDRFVRWHAATLPLELHRTETEGYRANLSGKMPAIFVVLRKIRPSEKSAGNDIAPFLVTASPYEAEGYLEGEDVVEVTPMPEALAGWVQAFVQRHHIDEPFVKRKRKRTTDGEAEREASPRVRQRGLHG